MPSSFVTVLFRLQVSGIQRAKGLFALPDVPGYFAFDVLDAVGGRFGLRRNRAKRTVREISGPPSKSELDCGLQQPRRHCTHDPAKARAADITVDHCRAKELRMIEGIESFEAELK